MMHIDPAQAAKQRTNLLRFIKRLEDLAYRIPATFLYSSGVSANAIAASLPPFPFEEVE